MVQLPPLRDLNTNDLNSDIQRKTNSELFLQLCEYQESRY